MLERNRVHSENTRLFAAMEGCMSKDRRKSEAAKEIAEKNAADRDQWAKDCIDISKKLLDSGFIPDRGKIQFTRGADQHPILDVMWKDAANNHGQIIKELHKALDQELAVNGKYIKQLMDKNPKKADTPCGGKMDFIRDALKELQKAANEEKEKAKLDLSARGIAGAVVKGAAGLAAQGMRATLPEWISHRTVGPAPSKVEPPKPITLIEAAAKAGNKEALSFQTALKAHNAASSADAKAAGPSADAKSSAPPSPGLGRSQD